MAPVRVMPSPAERARQPKVHHHHSAALVEHDVARLQIAVDDAFTMGGGQSAGHLRHDVDRFGDLQFAALS